MAYDLVKRKKGGRDWSCSLGSEAPQTESNLKAKLPTLATFGVIGFGLWAILNQPSGRELQEYHLRRNR